MTRSRSHEARDGYATHRWRRAIERFITKGIRIVSELAERSEKARELLARSFQRWESLLAMGLKAMLNACLANDPATSSNVPRAG